MTHTSLNASIFTMATALVVERCLRLSGAGYFETNTNQAGGNPHRLWRLVGRRGSPGIQLVPGSEYIQPDCVNSRGF